MKPYVFFFFFFFFFAVFNNERVFSKIKSIFKNYLLEQDSPFNIAVFRIVFFAFVLMYLDRESITWFSHLPSSLLFPPVGMNYFLSIIPITPALVQTTMMLFVGSCVLAMVGCFARIASLAAAILGIYVLGIPEFYGQVNCPNHLIWFMLILSASRCSDVLSVDAIWKACREADQGREPAIKNSTEYALPLRFIWLLIGVIYFFPGFWKFFKSQWSWAYSENFKYLLYGEWFERGGWLPLFRVDQHPFLYKLCGLGTMFFELSFVFLILSPALRPMAAIAGILFHNMTRLFMQIDFFELQICYVAFINWAGLFAKIGQWISKEPRSMRYDGNSPMARRMAAIRSKFDIFQRTIYLDSRAQKVSAGAAVTQPSGRFSFDTQIIKFTGAALLLINSLFGIKEEMSGWPFTCYPTFSRRMTEAITDTITPYGVAKNKEEAISFNVLKERMTFPRFAGMIRCIIALPDEVQKRNKLKTLVSVMKQEGVDLRRYSKIRFYQTTYSTQPEKIKEPPISRELLEEIDI
jgi:hypothetical protein